MQRASEPDSGPFSLVTLNRSRVDRTTVGSARVGIAPDVRQSASPWRGVRYLISLPGMNDGGVASFHVRGHWHVYNGTPGPGLVPFREDRRTHSLEEVTFLADCVSFDHDTPAVVRPSAGTRAARRPLIDTLFPYPQSREDQTLGYFEAVESTLAAASDLRFGNGSPTLRYLEYPALLDLHRRFAGVAEPLTLYAMATRQVEVLSEYLCFYRVIEWARKDNGVAYIEDRLSKLPTHDFGDLWAERFRATRRWNIFRLYQARAARRIRDLRARFGSDHAVAVHLYSIRNSLAHGKAKFVLDRPADLAEIGRTLVVVKLLARLVVERVP
jgi:hypothetical protein